jgi:hypothetical protein
MFRFANQKSNVFQELCYSCMKITCGFMVPCSTTAAPEPPHIALAALPMTIPESDFLNYQSSVRAVHFVQGVRFVQRTNGIAAAGGALWTGDYVPLDERK